MQYSFQVRMDTTDDIAERTLVQRLFKISMCGYLVSMVQSAWSAFLYGFFWVL